MKTTANTTTKKTRTRSTARTAVKATIAAAAAVSATLAIASAAEAANSVSISGGYTTMFAGENAIGANTYYGTVTDTKSDGYCIRVYGRGYNIALGTGRGTYRGQACGNGSSTRWSETPAIYSDNYSVSLCRGMPNSTRSNCTGYAKIR